MGGHRCSVGQRNWGRRLGGEVLWQKIRGWKLGASSGWGVRRGLLPQKSGAVDRPLPIAKILLCIDARRDPVLLA